VETLIS